MYLLLFSYGSVLKTMNILGISLFLMAFLSASSCMAPVSGKKDKDLSRTEEVEKLLSLAQEKGVIKVIVELKVPEIEKLTRSAAKLKDPDEIATADREIAERIAKTADSVIDQLKKTHYKINRRYSTLQYLAMDVSVEALEILLASPDVGGIEEDVPEPLIDSPTTY